jgi:hypothetical protein
MGLVLLASPWAICQEFVRKSQPYPQTLINKGLGARFESLRPLHFHLVEVEESQGFEPEKRTELLGKAR